MEESHQADILRLLLLFSHDKTKRSKEMKILKNELRDFLMLWSTQSISQLLAAVLPHLR